MKRASRRSPLINRGTNGRGASGGATVGVGRQACSAHGALADSNPLMLMQVTTLGTLRCGACCWTSSARRKQPQPQRWGPASSPPRSPRSCAWERASTQPGSSWPRTMAVPATAVSRSGSRGEGGQGAGRMGGCGGGSCWPAVRGWEEVEWSAPHLLLFVGWGGGAVCSCVWPSPLPPPPLPAHPTHPQPQIHTIACTHAP